MNMRDEIDIKNQMLEDYAINLRDTLSSKEGVRSPKYNLITPKELSDLKKNLADKANKLKELDQILSD